MPVIYPPFTGHENLISEYGTGRIMNIIHVIYMSQDALVKLESQGDSNGVGKGHIRYTRKNKKIHKERMEIKKYNPVARAHTTYKEIK